MNDSHLAQSPGYSWRRDYLLWTLLAALPLLAAYHPRPVSAYWQWVDWPTLGTLLGLLALATAMEWSGYLYATGEWVVHYAGNERSLACLLVALSASLATVLTNDVALFIVVPLTVGLSRFAKLPIRRYVVFEALAVNVGSMLTPIGNPQNIYLWQSSGVHFLSFSAAMLPPVIISMVCLLAFIHIAFSGRPLHVSPPLAAPPRHRAMLVTSVVLFIPFVVLADMHHVDVGLLLVLGVFLAFFRGILKKLDWALLIVFVLMFIDLGQIAELDWVREQAGRLALHQPLNLYLAGVGLSQFISNVPAAILLSRYSTNWPVLAWAVDVGGFGFLIGSLANLIALRLARQPGGFWEFHRWSLPFFLATAALAGLWLAA